MVSNTILPTEQVASVQKGVKMLKYFQPANWFFILIAMAMCCYIAYNFNNNRLQTNRNAPVAASLIRSIVR